MGSVCTPGVDAWQQSCYALQRIESHLQLEASPRSADSPQQTQVSDDTEMDFECGSLVSSRLLGVR